MSKTFKRYLITSLLAVGLCFVIALLRDLFLKENLKDILHVLIDSTFVVAVLFVGFGLLIFAANEGTFDMLAYGMTSFISLFKKDRESYLKYKTYVDYKEAKADKKNDFGYILVVGLIVLAISMVFVVWYENIK